MADPESLKLLTAKSPSLHRTDPGKTEFDWRDVAGAIGKCSKMARELAFLKFQLLPERGHPRLEAFIDAFRMSEVLPLFERENWKAGPVSAMARLVIEDAVLPWTCKACQGVGERVSGGRVLSCVVCSGSGRKRLTEGEKARQLGIPERSWWVTWHSRYNHVQATVAAWEAEIERALRGS